MIRKNIMNTFKTQNKKTIRKNNNANKPLSRMLVDTNKLDAR